MTLRHARFLSTVLLLTCGVAACRRGADASTGDAREFFRGKTMTYVVATDPGGGYDTYARLVSKFLVRHLGMSRVIVKNVPGGSHFIGTNEIYHARPDGLTLGTFNTGLIYAQLLRREGLYADLGRMSWIGKGGDEPRVLIVSARSGFRSIEDIRRAPRPVLIGADGVGNSGYNDAMLIAHVLGLRLKPVFGLTTRESLMSMMRGEIEAELGTASSHREFIANGFGRPVLRIGGGEGVDDGIPAAGDLAITAEGRAIVALVRSLAALLRWTAGPPGIPADRLEILREAYTAALSDPDLLEEARRLEIPIVPMDGETLAREVARALDLPPETIARIAAITGAARP